MNIKKVKKWFGRMRAVCLHCIDPGAQLLYIPPASPALKADKCEPLFAE
jgi:hypothetical protein